MRYAILLSFGGGVVYVAAVYTLSSCDDRCFVVVTVLGCVGIICVVGYCVYYVCLICYVAVVYVVPYFIYVDVRVAFFVVYIVVAIVYHVRRY